VDRAAASVAWRYLPAIGECCQSAGYHAESSASTLHGRDPRSHKPPANPSPRGDRHRGWAPIDRAKASRARPAARPRAGGRRRGGRTEASIYGLAMASSFCRIEVMTLGLWAYHPSSSMRAANKPPFGWRDNRAPARKDMPSLISTGSSKELVRCDDQRRYCRPRPSRGRERAAAGFHLADRRPIARPQAAGREFVRFCDPRLHEGIDASIQSRHVVGSRAHRLGAPT